MTATTKRERAARAALLDAATEVASFLGTASPRELAADLAYPGDTRATDAFAVALGALYAANDEWQEAQLRGADE